MSANILQKATGASPSGLTDSLVFDNGSNVGVGTTTPGSSLDVVGVIRSDTGYTVTGAVASAGFMRLQSNSTGMQARNAANTADVGLITTDSSDNLILGFFNVQALILKPQNNERVRIDSSGNVGIGTSAPSYLLDVAGSGSGTFDIARLQNTVAAANGSGAELLFAQTGLQEV
jgi:hypothetical protein